MVMFLRESDRPGFASVSIRPLRREMEGCEENRKKAYIKSFAVTIEEHIYISSLAI